MVSTPPPVPQDRALLVLGAANADPADRRLPLSELRPMQVIVEDKPEALRFLGPWGETNVSSLAWHPDSKDVCYAVADAGLVRIDLERGSARNLEVKELRDVHEITLIGRSLWLANTGVDEVVEFDIDREEVTRRVSLSRERFAVKLAEHPGDRDSASGANASQEVDRFHCNQVFSGYSGELLCLVHHANGKQRLRRAAERLLKIQGNGGVIDLDGRPPFRLGLSAPHTARRVAGEYWILDSGNATINVYARDADRWVLRRKVQTRGWARGADYLTNAEGDRSAAGLAFVGISQTRKRYLDGLRRGGLEPVANMVEVLRIEDGKSLGEYPIPNVEQINNVYLIERRQALRLLSLDRKIWQDSQ